MKAKAARPTATSSGRVRCSRPLSHLARQPRPENEVVERARAPRAAIAQSTFASSVQRKPGPVVPVVRGERNARDAEHEQRPVADRPPPLPEHAHRRDRAPPLRAARPPERRRRRARPCRRPRPPRRAGARRLRHAIDHRRIDWHGARIPKIELHVHLEGTVRPETLLEIARRNDYALPCTTVEELRGALRVPRLRALHRGLDPHDERAADERRLPAGRRRLRGRGRRARRRLHRGHLLAGRARPPRRRLGRDLQRLLRRRRGGARALRRRGAPDARHRARLPARRSGRGRAPRGEVPRSRRRRHRPRRPRGASSRRSRTSRRSRSRATRASPRCRTRARSPAPRPSAARSTRSAPTASATASAPSRTPASCASSPSAQIVLDVCPISNLRTRAVASLDEHPLPQLVAAGVPCSISTDDPAMFDTDLTRDYDARAFLGVDPRACLRGRRPRRALRRGDEIAPSKEIGEATDWPRRPRLLSCAMRTDERAWHGLIVAGRCARRGVSSAGLVPRAEDSRSCEDTMFFPKLRAHAKWVFVLLAIVFAAQLRLPRRRLGLVGARRPAAGQLRRPLRQQQRLIPRRSKKDQKRIEKNPKDYAAYKDLAARSGVRRKGRRGDRHAAEAQGREPEGRRRADPARQPLPAARPTRRASWP